MLSRISSFHSTRRRVSQRQMTKSPFTNLTIPKMRWYANAVRTGNTLKPASDLLHPRMGINKQTGHVYTESTLDGPVQRDASWSWQPVFVNLASKSQWEFMLIEVEQFQSTHSTSSQWAKPSDSTTERPGS